MHEGRRFVLTLDEVEGQGLEITVVWDTVDFFGEILNSRHDASRSWFEDATEETRQTFSLHPFVGPVVTYGDAWDVHGPLVESETLALAKKQLLSCLMAVGPADEGRESQLSFLLFEIEDANGDGEELRPFVTTIAISRWILDTEDESGIESISARRL